jgi:CHAD domain-containing protein
MVKARQIKGIDCDGTALVGIRRALEERFDEMCGLREHALNWKDPEGVHSMRVASRRLRSALSSFMPYANRRNLTAILKQIRSIADTLGDVRDHDVAILELEKLASQAAPELSSTLQQLIETRNKLRKATRQQLKKAIGKGRLKEVALDFENAVATVTSEVQPATKPGDSEVESYINVARAVIRDRLDDLEELSSSLYHPSEGKQLHEMRIAAKRLRYAIELFEGCWNSDLASFAKYAARLQTDLGKLHDCDDWIASFEKEIAKSKKLKDRAETETFVWLFTHFSELRNQHYRDAFSKWNEWQVGKVSDKLRDALKSSS